MKKVVVCLIYLCSLSTHASDPSPIPGLKISDGEISWTDNGGWVQVQDMESYRVVGQCEGLITSCAVLNDRSYQVIDHSNGWKSTRIIPSSVGSPSSPESSASCVVNYSLPQDGNWYQLQETNTYSTVCQTSGNSALTSPCSLDPGTYQLVVFRNGSATANETQLRCDVPSSPDQQALSLDTTVTLNSTESLNTTGHTRFPVVTSVGYGSFDNNMWQEMMLDSRIWSGSSANIRTAVVNGRKAHIHKMNPTPRGNDAGTDRVQAAFDISRRTEATLVQWIRMEPDYAMGRNQQSGKWGFGLVGGSGPTGGRSSTDGFSVRLAPYGDGTQPDTMADAAMHLYVYSADKINPRFGDAIPLIDPDTNSAFVMPRDGSWVQFAMYAKMNSSANARDGILRGYVNGVLMLEQTGKRWFGSNQSGSPHIDRIIVNTFMGGNTGEWAPSKVNEIMFADISLGFKDR